MKITLVNNNSLQTNLNSFRINVITKVVAVLHYYQHILKKKLSMEYFNYDKKAIVLIFATLFTGLLAGVFFTWTNAITPGIGRLSDINYLQAFQYMNRTIINPLFYIVIISPLILSPLAAYLYKNSNAFILKALIGASVLYFLGVFVVTIFANIPLNKMLDNLQLSNISLEQARIFRDKYEDRWNNLHLIRTITSTTSFILLIVACLYNDEKKQ